MILPMSCLQPSPIGLFFVDLKVDCVVMMISSRSGHPHSADFCCFWEVHACDPYCLSFFKRDELQQFVHRSSYTLFKSVHPLALIKRDILYSSEFLNPPLDVEYATIDLEYASISSFFHINSLFSHVTDMYKDPMFSASLLEN